MYDIPMDLERRFERRWAARFSGPAKEHRLEEQQRATAPDESKTRNRRAGERGPVRAPARFDLAGAFTESSRARLGSVQKG
jgi:hypothetical protein